MIRFEQYTRRIDDVEGRIEAYDLGLKKDLRREFQDLESEDSIEQELASLKKKMAGGDSH